MSPALESAVEAVKEAELALFAAVAKEFPVGSAVTYKSFRGPVQSVVKGTDGEAVVIADGEGTVRRHFDKVAHVGVF